MRDEDLVYQTSELSELLHRAVSQFLEHLPQRKPLSAEYRAAIADVHEVYAVLRHTTTAELVIPNTIFNRDRLDSRHAQSGRTAQQASATPTRKRRNRYH
jgi:hypothetical protein